VVLNIYNTVHTYNTKKSGTITGKAAIVEPQFQTNIWVASVDATQKVILKHCHKEVWQLVDFKVISCEIHQYMYTGVCLNFDPFGGLVLVFLKTET